MILEMKNIVKTYGNVVANNKVNINLNKGEILAVVGENGAGKSTIMKILYGLEKPDSGEIFINGKKMNFHNPSDSMAQGIGMVQQHFMLFESMTVAENIVYKNEMKKGVFFDYKKNIQMVEELSKRYMLKVDPNAIVEECPVGLQQRVEILKTLYQNADIIIYAGSLVNPELLEYAKDSAEIYNSAKMNLDEVIDVMKQGDTKNIVRLHTGDPCVYGAIREQMDRLDKLGIEYDVCPGVSSFCGAAAALKAEYTLPDVSQTVIITRMEGRTPVPPKEKIHLLASHNATMVIFLSTGLLKELSAELVKGGYSENTPAAIVYKATWKDEKVMRCTVGTLNETAEKNGIKKTALITVGDFLGDDYSLSKLYDKTFTTEFRKGVTE